MTDSGNAKVLQVFRGKTGQQVCVDRILAECRLILLKTKRSQPVRDVHRAPRWQSLPPGRTLRNQGGTVQKGTVAAISERPVRVLVDEARKLHRRSF
jgi:hypothetical protein